jgi:hypothetical protein
MTQVESAFDRRDVTAILSGVFYINGRLADIANDIHAIRRLLEDGDEEEEEEGGDGGGEGPQG